jgi:hypothetical protein
MKTKRKCIYLRLPRTTAVHRELIYCVDISGAMVVWVICRECLKESPNDTDPLTPNPILHLPLSSPRTQAGSRRAVSSTLAASSAPTERSSVSPLRALILSTVFAAQRRVLFASTTPRRSMFAQVIPDLDPKLCERYKRRGATCDFDVK